MTDTTQTTDPAAETNDGATAVRPGNPAAGSAPASTETPPTPDPADDTQEPGEADDEAGSGQDDATGKARREAKSLRTRLRDTETDRDAAVARADSAERAIVAHALETTGLDQRLWDAAKVELDSLRDEAGHLSVAGVLARAAQLRTEFGLAPPAGVPAPNPQQGSPSAKRGTGWVQAFDANQRRRG